MSHQTRVVIVVPAFNEAGRFDEHAFSMMLAEQPGVRLLFVDDGSTDDTREVLQRFAGKCDGRVDLLSLQVNSGKAEAVRTGLLAAAEGGVELIGYLDADLSAPPASIALLVSALADHPDAWIALGSRVRMLGHRVERSATRHYLGRVFATFASITLGLPVYDTQCGCKLLRNSPQVREALAAPFESQWIFDVELLARLVSADGPPPLNRFREVPLEEWRAKDGSQLRLRDWLRAPIELWRIRRRHPIRR